MLILECLRGTKGGRDMAEHLTFATSDPSESEMLDVLRQRVKSVYGLTLIEYARARRRGSLPEVPGRAALEVFAGDFGCASKQAPEGADRVRR